jgi:hypothetical protein
VRLNASGRGGGGGSGGTLVVAGSHASRGGSGNSSSSGLTLFTIRVSKMILKEEFPRALTLPLPLAAVAVVAVAVVAPLWWRASRSMARAETETTMRRTEKNFILAVGGEWIEKWWIGACKKK